MSIIKTLLGVGNTPLDRYIGRNKPKSWQKWCPLCGGKGTVGIPDIFPCPRCFGKGRVTNRKKTFSQPADIDIDSVTPPNSTTGKISIKRQPVKERKEVIQYPKVGFFKYILAILGIIVGFLVGISLVQSLRFRSGIDPLVVGLVGSIVGALIFTKAKQIIYFIFNIILKLFKTGVKIIIYFGIVAMLIYFIIYFLNPDLLRHFGHLLIHSK